MLPMDIILIIIGIVLLVAGRNLFWLLVGMVGFVAGYSLASNWLSGTEPWVGLLIGILAGFAGAWLAHAFQHLMISIAGFLVGGWALLKVMDWIQVGASFPDWAVFGVGGLIGLLLVAVAFDWALILLSSIGGAVLITENLELSSNISLLVTIGLVVAGIWLQRKFSHH